MDADENALFGTHVSGYEGEMLLAVEQRLETVGGELAVLGRDPRRATRSTSLLPVTPVTDEIADGDDGKTVVGGELLQLGPARHALLVRGHDLAQQPRGIAARKACEVDGRLGVAGALEHATRPISQRQHVTRPGEVVGLGVGAMSAWIVAARSPAEMPVVVPGGSRR